MRKFRNGGFFILKFWGFQRGFSKSPFGGVWGEAPSFSPVTTPLSAECYGSACGVGCIGRGIILFVR